MSDQMERFAPGAWREWLVRLAQALRFFSRLPVPRLPFESANPHAVPEFSPLVPVVPLAGLIIGLLPALTLLLAMALGFGPLVAATLSVALLTLVTGALHEDGLADTFDSLGAATRERRLEIMRDSRIGSYGASVLILGFALRIGALAQVADEGGAAIAASAVLVAASLSRIAGLTPLSFLPPARADGAAQAVGRPSREAFWTASAVAAAVALFLGALTPLSVGAATLMWMLSFAAGWGMTRFSARHLGGHTGDIAGATQQLAEIAALLGLLIAGAFMAT